MKSIGAYMLATTVAFSDAGVSLSPRTDATVPVESGRPVRLPEGDAVKERPILFSAPMVRAILEGRKTQTRRLIKFTKEQEPPTGDLYLQRMYGHTTEGRPFGDFAHWRIVGPDYPDGDADDVRCPYGGFGDRLWVREGHYFTHVRGHERSGEVIYAADYPDAKRPPMGVGRPWKPSIHLPRWASRITLEVTGVRVERLQDISEADAIKEGMAPLVAGLRDKGGWARDQFFNAWSAINGPDSWAANPWVWVIEFRRLP